ncbi:MAG TPA: HAD family phosphatase [Caulobacteraceae bacterium]|nr:HAD family phosphatase [Caulobacteraceae bacterium]
MRFPRPIQAVVFDMDGLLIDSEALVRAGIVRAAQALGHHFPDALFARTVGCSDTAYEASVREHFGPDFPMERFLAREAVEIERAFAAGVCLKTGVIELIDHVERRGLMRAVATSSSRATARRHLGDHGLADRFHAIVAREDVTRHKPAPDPYFEAARRLGMAPAACLALEDSHNGVRSAHAAGMMVVMVPDLLEPTAEMHGLCVRIASDLHEVHRWIEAAG